MLVGLDFDNTLAGYDEVFVQGARARNLVAPDFTGTKKQVRDAIRLRPDGERDWMALQGRVYGAMMGGAALIDGVAPFLESCRERGIDVCIVSHKTEYGHFDPDRINLRDAARAWMAEKGFFTAFGLDPERVFFAGTRAEKVARIAELGCSHFVDDLPEVFAEPGFPEATKRYLYHATEGVAPEGAFDVHAHWSTIAEAILGDLG